LNARPPSGCATRSRRRWAGWTERPRRLRTLRASRTRGGASVLALPVWRGWRRDGTMAVKRLAMTLTTGALLSLAACDQISASFDKSFNEAWPKSFKDGCMKTASQHVGAPAADQYCSCLVGELSPLPVKEKMSLKADSPTMTAAVNKCMPQAPT